MAPASQGGIESVDDALGNGQIYRSPLEWEGISVHPRHGGEVGDYLSLGATAVATRVSGNPWSGMERARTRGQGRGQRRRRAYLERRASSRAYPAEMSHAFSDALAMERPGRHPAIPLHR